MYLFKLFAYPWLNGSGILIFQKYPNSDLFEYCDGAKPDDHLILNIMINHDQLGSISNLFQS